MLMIATGCIPLKNKQCFNISLCKNIATMNQLISFHLIAWVFCNHFLFLKSHDLNYKK